MSNKERLIAINDEIQALQQLAAAESRSLSDVETSKINALFAEFKSLENLLDAQEAIETVTTVMGRSQGRKAEPQEIEPQHGNVRERPQSTRRSGHGDNGPRHPLEITRNQTKPFQGRSAIELFGKAANDKGGFRDTGKFVTIIANGLHDPRLVKASYSNEGEGASGGFAVPGYMSAQIWDNALENSIFLGRMSTYPMQGPTLSIPSINYADRSSSTGGLTTHWTAEGATSTSQTPLFRSLDLRAHKVMIYCDLTSELAADAPNAERLIIDTMGRSLGYGIDEAIINGTGVGQPTGILTAASLIKVPRASGQAADTILYENIVTMLSRLAPGVFADAIWVGNVDILPQLLTCVYPVSSGTAPLFLQSASIEGRVAGSILGRPLFLSENASQLGDAGDLILVSPRQLIHGQRLDMALDRSNAPGWSQDLISLRLTSRLDVQPAWNSVITPKHGSNTLSWAVAIDDRS